jgi:hypothetical protein
MGMAFRIWWEEERWEGYTMLWEDKWWRWWRGHNERGQWWWWWHDEQVWMREEDMLVWF